MGMGNSLTSRDQVVMLFIGLHHNLYLIWAIGGVGTKMTNNSALYILGAAFHATVVQKYGVGM